MDYNSQMDAANKQASSAVQNMNYTFQNYELERQDAFTAAVEQVAKTRMAADVSQATLAVALGERGNSGNTSRLIQRAAEGKEAEAVADIKDNYQSKSNEIDLNREAAARSTASYLSNIQYPSEMGLLMNIAGTALNTYNKALDAKTNAQINHLGFSFSNYYWNGDGTTQTRNTETKSYREKEVGHR
jgi:hypothetical protein